MAKQPTLNTDNQGTNMRRTRELVLIFVAAVIFGIISLAAYVIYLDSQETDELLLEGSVSTPLPQLETIERTPASTRQPESEVIPMPPPGAKLQDLSENPEFNDPEYTQKNNNLEISKRPLPEGVILR